MHNCRQVLNRCNDITLLIIILILIITFCAVIVMHRHITAVSVTSVLQFPVLSVLIPVPESRKSQYGFPYSRLVLDGTTVLPWNRGTYFSRYQYRRGDGTTVVPQYHKCRGTTVRYLPTNSHFSEVFRAKKTVY